MFEFEFDFIKELTYVTGTLGILKEGYILLVNQIFTPIPNKLKPEIKPKNSHLSLFPIETSIEVALNVEEEYQILQDSTQIL